MCQRLGVDRIVLDLVGSDRLRRQGMRHMGGDPGLCQKVGEPAPGVGRLEWHLWRQYHLFAAGSLRDGRGAGVVTRALPQRHQEPLVSTLPERQSSASPSSRHSSTGRLPRAIRYPVASAFLPGFLPSSRPWVPHATNVHYRRAEVMRGRRADVPSLGYAARLDRFIQNPLEAPQLSGSGPINRPGRRGDAGSVDLSKGVSRLGQSSR